MLTPNEYLTNTMPRSNELWINGLDIVSHCLQRDHTQSFYKDDSPALHHWDEWSDAMQDKVKAEDNFDDIYDNAYAPKKAWKNINRESGALCVSSYLSGAKRCFKTRKKLRQTHDALSILIDISIPYCERSQNYMVKRHKAVYELIAQCDSDDRPVQIVGVTSQRIPELKKPLNIFIMVKDYNDSIFPSIWGALKTNETCNSFINVIMDYFVGTSTFGNGSPRDLLNAEQYFPMNEELIIFGSRIQSNNAIIKGV